MRVGKIQVIGIFVAIAFAIIMLTVGRVVPQSEVDAKKAEAASQRELDKVKLESGFIEMKNEDGIVFEKFDPESSKDITRYEMNDGEVYNFTFALLEKDTYEVLDEKSIDLSKLYIETNNVHISFSALSNLEYIEETGAVKFTSTARINQSHGVGDVDLEVNLLSSMDDVKVIKIDPIPVTSPFVSDEEEVVNDTVTKEESPTYDSSPDAYGKGSLADQKVNGENIDDWSHILDQDEIEDYSFEEGLH